MIFNFVNIRISVQTNIMLLIPFFQMRKAFFYCHSKRFVSQEYDTFATGKIS